MINKKIRKEILSWSISFILAVLIVNLSLYVIYRPAAWIDTEYNASHGLFAPNSKIVYGEEGYGIRTVDSNGYANPSYRLDYDSYILFLGSSHTVGKELMFGKNYVDILESKYNCRVYNMAMDGHYYCDIVSGFDSAIKQFPNAECVVIEIDSTDFSEEELLVALSSRQYYGPHYITDKMRSLSTKDKFKYYYQKYFPIVRAINKNIKANNNSTYSSEIPTNNIKSAKYEEKINQTLHSLKADFSGKIIIAYHPPIQLSDDGSIIIQDSNTKNIFMNCCKESGIVFIDLTDKIISEYNNNFVLPYGFCNSAYGKGHLNSTGHILMAELIFQELSDVQR